jgi:hypothetical protein
MNLERALECVIAAIDLAKDDPSKKDLYRRALGLKEALATQIQINSQQS